MEVKITLMKKTKTKAHYEGILNAMTDLNSNGTDRTYGTKLRRNDPIQFNVGYNEWLRKMK
jgi:hypothetical protein